MARKGSRSRFRSRRQRGARTSQQVELKPMGMRQVPASWDPAVFDKRPMPIPRRDQICTIRRTYTLDTLAANTGTTSKSYYFSLDSVVGYGEFTALFDQYRIMEAIVTFTPYSTNTASTSVGSAYPGIIGHALDYDDAQLTNISGLQQYESYQRNSCTEPFTRVVLPRSAIAAYSGAFTSYANVYGQWHDAASPSVQHYGLKLNIVNSTFATSTNIYEVEATVTMQFRSPH